MIQPSGHTGLEGDNKKGTKNLSKSKQKTGEKVPIVFDVDQAVESVVDFSSKIETRK